jgi:16S rRNA (guanine966-N2)-methyltransferase
MRIVGGSAKGRTLKAPRSQKIRPTADRVRETLFNILGQYFEGGEVLDVYAGTGALAFEALSRGCDRAVLVDSGAEALALCRENAAALGFEKQVEILAMPAQRGFERLGKAKRSFSLIFVDPPYALEAGTGALEAVTSQGLLDPEGTLVIEHDKHEELPEAFAGLTRTDHRTFGDTGVSFYRFVTE